MDGVAAREPLSAVLAADLADRVVANLAKAVHAAVETLRLPLLCLFAEGHVLVEDVPGVGKTVLAKALARSLDLEFSRLQFTPDLLPSDVTGVNAAGTAATTHEAGPAATRAELAGFLRDQGVAVGRDAGVGVLRRELDRLGVRSDAFVAAFARACYGPPQGAPAAATDARRELATVRRALRARLGPGRRVRGFLALRSLRSS